MLVRCFSFCDSSETQITRSCGPDDIRKCDEVICHAHEHKNLCRMCQVSLILSSQFCVRDDDCSDLRNVVIVGGNSADSQHEKACFRLNS